MYAYKHLTMLYVNDIHIIDSWKWNQSYKFNLNRFLFFLVACFIIYFSPIRGSFVCFCLSPWIDQLKGGVPLGFPVCSRHPLTCKLKSICRDYSGALSLSPFPMPATPPTCFSSACPRARPAWRWHWCGCCCCCCCCELCWQSHSPCVMDSSSFHSFA